MIELELKSVVPDWDSAVRRVEASGAALVFAGRLEDRGYDTPERALKARDHVLRVRTYRAATGVRAELGWKGPTTQRDGLKEREELAAGVSDPDALASILGRLGYVVTFAIDRDIRQYTLHGATVRFERYPRMDPLLEVEGSTEQIELAISATGLARDGFTSERLADFVRRYELRTGTTAVTADEVVMGASDRSASNG